MPCFSSNSDSWLSSLWWIETALIIGLYVLLGLCSQPPAVTLIYLDNVPKEETASCASTPTVRLSLYKKNQQWLLLLIILNNIVVICCSPICHWAVHILASDHWLFIFNPVLDSFFSHRNYTKQTANVTKYYSKKFHTNYLKGMKQVFHISGKQ